MLVFFVLGSLSVPEFLGQWFYLLLHAWMCVLGIRLRMVRAISLALVPECFTETVKAASGCVKQRGQQQDLKAVTGMGSRPRLERADFRGGPLILHPPLLRLFAVIQSSVSRSGNCAPRGSWSAKLQTSPPLLTQDTGSRAGRTNNLEILLT